MNVASLHGVYQLSIDIVSLCTERGGVSAPSDSGSRPTSGDTGQGELASTGCD